MPVNTLIVFWRKCLFIILCIFICLSIFIFHSSVYSSSEKTTIAIEDDPTMVAVNPLTNRAVITHGHSNTNSISIVDLNTERVITELSVAKLPNGVAIDTIENIAVITHENERLLTFIDLNTNNVIATLDIDTKPRNIAINSETHIAAITSAIDKEVLFVDLNTRTVVAQTDVEIKSGDLASDPQRNIAFVLNKNKNNINVIDMNNYTLSYSIALDKKPQAIDVNPETNTAIITNYQDKSVTIVDLLTKRLVTKSLGTGPLDVAINTIDNRAVVLCDQDRKLILLDLSTNEIIKTYSLPRHPHSVAIISNRNTAIVADDETDSLTIIQLPLSAPLPKIKITSPQDKAQISSNSVDVLGTVENSTNVTVNDIIALVSGNNFSSKLTMEEGENTIFAIATDKYGRTASDDITVNIVVPVKGTVTGTVINGLNGSPLPSAVVTITDAKGNTQTIVTNALGTFTAQVAEGAYSGTVIKPWYLPFSFAGSVAIGETNVINVPLTPIQPVISNIKVTDITENSVKINWTTDQPTQGRVEYGATTSYGSAVSNSLEETTHSLTLSNLTPSTTYHFRVVASSGNGTTTYSSDNSFKTNGRIVITINSPANGANISGNNVTVTGSINNAANVETGVTVNGMAAALNNNQFVVNNVPLNAGANTITVTATDVNGTTASKSITVNTTIPENFITLSAYPESGVAPLEVILRISGTFSVTNPVIIPIGPGIVEQLESDNPDEYKYKMTTEGIYYFTAQVTGPDGNIYQDTKAVTVLPLAQVDALLRAKWATFKTALSNQDINNAVLNFVSGSQDTYRSLYTNLKPLLQNICAELNAAHINYISINNNKAIYEIIVTRNNVTYSFQLEFVKDANGIWKMLKF
ncbi:MAG: fibronectin type III domain-containing protein [Syntrophaceae bacterium]|nr:fibronectin type III domain-containing protein [Syntrophaceae bacterium]